MQTNATVSEAEQAVRESLEERQLLRTLIDNLPAYIFVKDTAGRYLISNTAHTRLLGAGSESEVFGKTVFHFFPRSIAQSYDVDDKALIQTGQPVLEREELYEAGGQRIWYRLTKVPLRNARGEIVALIGIKHDITKRKQSEAALWQSEGRYRSLVEQSPTGIFVNVDNQFAYVNRAFCRIVGAKTPDELLGTSVFERFDPAYHEVIRERIERVLSHREAVPLMDQSYRRMDGSPVHVETTATPTEFQGAPAIQVLVNDVTERKRAEAALAAERQLLRTLVDNLPAYIFVKDTSGRYLLVNDSHRRQLGLGADTEMLGKTSFDFFPEEIARRFAEDDRMVIESGQAVLEREEPFEAGGQKGWFLTTKVPLRDAHGTINGLIGIAIDISERKRVIESLKASDERFQMLFDASPDAIIVAAQGGAIQEVNGQAERLFGYAKEELIGKPIETLMPRRLAGNHLALREAYAGNPTLRPMGEGRELFACRKDGTEFPVDISLSPIATANGAMVISTIRDISARKREEEALKLRATELERFHRLSVGRELQMIELKKEVNELARLAGRTPPYDLSNLDKGAKP